jgi:3',5'-cyclic AMP phosphodiesterase CpdA
VDEGDSSAIAQRDRHREQARERQWAYRARKTAKQPASSGRCKAAARTEAGENQLYVCRNGTVNTLGNCEGECIRDVGGSSMHNQYNVDDDEPLPTAAH